MLEAWVMVLGGSSVALQLSSQRSNVDFKPIVDHYSAVEYATKYATKKEKGSKPFDTLVAHALNSGGRAEAKWVAQSVAAEESSVLLYIATCVNAVALVLVGVLLERARSRRADTPRRPLEQPCSEPAPTRCSRSEPCAPPAPAPPAPPARTVRTRIQFPEWPIGLAPNSCLIQMVLGIPVPAGPSPAVMATFRAANELLDLPPLHPPLVNACDQILTALHRLLTEADGIRAALELDEQLPLLRLIEEAEEMLELEPLEGSLQSRLGAIRDLLANAPYSRSALAAAA